MNRIVFGGLALFFSLVGIGVLGEPRSAKAWHGMHMGFACHGWNRCYGQGGCYGCHGCYGCSGCHGCSGAVRSCYGCHGCHGGHGCYGCAGGVPVTVPLPVQTEIWEPAPASPAPPAAATPTSANLRISLPADARLLVGDYSTESTGTVRYFQSPPLVDGKTYAYELTAELNRDGRTVTETKTVVVRAGQSAHVEFAIDAAQVAQALER